MGTVAVRKAPGSGLRPYLWLALAALALGLAIVPGGPARAELVLKEQAYELPPSRLQLPANAGPGDSLRVQPCASCPRVSLRVSSSTQWRIGQRGPLVTAGEFRSRFQQALAGSGDALVFVYYDSRSRTVNRVVLSATGRPAGTP